MTVKERSLISYIVIRVLQILPIVAGIVLLNFIIIHLAPGDPAIILAGEYETSPEYIEMLREQFGLNKPLYEQFFIYITNIAKGNLGYSLVYKEPVIDLIFQRVPATLLLMSTQLFFAVLLGILLGVSSSILLYTKVDSIITISSLIAYAIPSFWLAQILILLFSIKLGWFPVQGMVSLRTELSGLDYIIDVLYHLILPVVTLGAINTALITRLTRSNMLEILGKDFIITAKAKGLSKFTVIFKHALRNALLPVVTIVGMSVGRMVAGSVIVESVFGWPGVGRLLYDAIGWRDYPLILGIFLIISMGIVTTNLITDILYAYLDPRIRYR